MTYDIFRTDGRGQVVRQQQQPAPLGPHDVLVAVRAIGLNFRDVYFVKGNRFRPAAEGMIPFSDAAGLVEAVGSAVTRFKAGDRVNSTVLPNWIDGPLTEEGLAVSLGSRSRDGVLAEKIQVHEKELVAIPDSLSDIQAATLPIAALTAWHAVAELNVLAPGDTVVVQTTGGVAVFAIQFAKALGARVIVVSRSDDKLQLARQAGAHDVINSTVTPEWDQQVLALTGGKGAQLVLDMGLTDSLRRSARAVAFEGTVAIIGVVQEETNPLDIYTVMTRNINVRGVETGSRSMFQRMSRFIALHQIVPVIDRVFDVAQVDDALTYLAGSPFGKVVLRFA
ncbi:zinc-dependent alcohol dehydrogenase family protein [Janthinobacterium agaricidamnosum]|uniref:Zinc-binding dehydrogenase family protein n=1 Tax=Janthinobacterium agaricidamnosum NBRC 102515 = DSM 9628 TaxID=1349767 RepID=W0V027_9BURK|nr:NAD(P)-dependent alcohol dehydrogenase [Janthinobacterium agaricidamnosum]CDG81231.1 zinc-binding dehydrogenase family protein [Janthinobacterium agaricidamnosum NBRC 102515 = DSM 9628]